MRIFLGLVMAASVIYAQPLPLPGQAAPPPSPHFGSIIGTTPPVNTIARPPGTVLPPPPSRQGGRTPSVDHGRHGRQNVALYPVYYGGYPGYVEPPQAYATDGNNPAYNQGYDPSQQQQTPIVIINQNYRPDTANPAFYDYSNTPLPPPRPQPPPESFQAPRVAAPEAMPTIYLIAMKDKTILPALAYWVESDTLNYVTTEGQHNRASLALIDRDFSRQLNEERHVEFKLPAR